MNRRLVGVALALSALLLACFAGLAADPSALIVDADRPSVDHARPVDVPSAGNDLTRLFLPHHLAIARSIRRLGHLPLWDVRGFGGRPLVGNPQGGLFYPPTWLAWWSGAPSALGWITVGHLLFSGIGTYRIGRTLGMGEWGCLVAAGCVQASPYVLAQTFEGHYPHVWAACWYPWAFDAAIRLRRGDRRAIAVLAATLAATLLAGHPQEGFYLLIALGAWALHDGIVAIRSGDRREAFGLSIAWAGAFLVAIGLAGIELIPDVMAQPWGLREARLPLKLAGRYHAYPINLLQLLGPSALGGPADYFGHENYWESVTSIGLIPLALAIIGVAWSPDRRAVRGWLILVGAALWFAEGRKFGLFALLYEVVPGMDRFRVPARSLFLASLGAAMLAGLGIEALRARSVEASGWARLARRFAIGSAVLWLVVLAGSRIAGWRDFASNPTPSLAEGRRHGDRMPEVDRLLLGLARLSSDPMFHVPLAGSTLLLLLAWKRPGSRRGVALTLGWLGLVELGFHGHALMAASPADRFLGPDPISRALEQARPPGLEPPRIRVVDALYDDLRAGLHGFSKTNVNDSFQIQHAADLYETLYRLFDDRLEGRDGPMDQAVLDHRIKVRQAVLDRMGVSLLVADTLDSKSPWPLVTSGTWAGSTFAVHRNPSAMPRAYVVPRAEVAPDDAALVARFRETDAREAVLMPADPLGKDTSHRQPFTPAEWASDDPDRLVLRVETEAPGLLVVADTWMPGWSAEVDGQPAPVFRGNRAQKVIPLPDPGRHEVVLSYRTPGLTLGLALTTASALIWAILILPPLARRNRAEQASDVCH